jgi:hypothetical protein
MSKDLGPALGEVLQLFSESFHQMEDHSMQLRHAFEVGEPTTSQNQSSQSLEEKYQGEIGGTWFVRAGSPDVGVAQRSRALTKRIILLPFPRRFCSCDSRKASLFI